MKKNKYLNGVLPMLLINFSIGSVYCWTLFKEYVRDYTGFETWVTEWCFSLAILFLGMTAALGGRIVEKSVKISSWITLVMFTSGWLLTGFGIQTKNPWLTIFGFGVVQGIGLGFGYLTPVKTLMIWFDKRKGFAAGLAITGFGLAGVVANPIIAGFLETVPIYSVFYVLAGIYGFALFFAAILIHRPETDLQEKKFLAKTKISELLFTKKFILLWLALFINISCGLALISQEKQIYHLIGVNALSTVVLFCSINAVGNLLGRLFMASLQDRLAYKYIPYYLMAACSFVVCFFAAFFSNIVAITVLMIFVVQFFFGCGFSCLPNILHQNYGMKRLATVHGLMLSAWAFAGLFGNQLAAYIIHSFSVNILYSVLGIMFVFEMIILIVWAKFISHPVWETKEAAICADCGCECKGYRIVEWLGYDRKDDTAPQFRCENCKDVKLLQVKEKVKAGN
ncbi:MAG: OFA family MFS transporter [Defluviitaleaceae bacterium]|nr:OFA family MFS transporter [Defluviitaleaceae bacterium]